MCCCGGILAACACSFFGSCCCSICARDCGDNERFRKGPASRVPYIFLTFLALMFSIVMSLYGYRSFGHTPWVAPNGVTLCNTQSCQGNGVVYRVSFSLFVFFGVHAVAVHFMPEFHSLWFMMKLILFCVFLTVTFFFGPGGSNFFDGWSQFARVASMLFLILQVLVLILWAYGVNDDIVEKMEVLDKQQNDEYKLDEGESPGCCNMYCCYGSSLLMVSMSLILLSFILLGFFYTWFSSKIADCAGPEALVAITIAYLVITLCMTVSSVFDTASIFVTAIVDLYVTYLLYSGLSSNPNRACNTVFGKKEGSGSFWLGIIITAAALSYLGFGVSRHHKQFQNNKNNTSDIEVDLETGLKTEEGDDTRKEKGKKDPVAAGEDDHLDLGLDDDEGKKGKGTRVTRNEAKGDTTEEEEEENDERKANVMFHACMALGAIYICMLYTNWGSTVSGSSFAGESSAAMWVNIAAQWVTFALYVFSLVGPKYCICLTAEDEA